MSAPSPQMSDCLRDGNADRHHTGIPDNSIALPAAGAMSAGSKSR